VQALQVAGALLQALVLARHLAGEGAGQPPREEHRHRHRQRDGGGGTDPRVHAESSGHCGQRGQRRHQRAHGERKTGLESQGSLPAVVARAPQAGNGRASWARAV